MLFHLIVTKNFLFIIISSIHSKYLNYIVYIYYIYHLHTKLCKYMCINTSVLSNNKEEQEDCILKRNHPTMFFFQNVH